MQWRCPLAVRMSLSRTSHSTGSCASIRSPHAQFHPPPGKFHAIVVSCLSFGLIYAPLLALPIARTNVVLPVPKPLPVPFLNAAHQPAELLVKFKDGAPANLIQQVRTSWSHEASQPLPGRSGIERLTLKPGLNVAQAVAEVQQLTAIVEWVEPNYLVQVETGGKREGARERKSDGAKERQRKARRTVASSLAARRGD